MKIDEATLDRIAGLARLDMGDPAKRASMLADMQRVIEFVNALAEVDTKGVEPLIFLTEEEDVLRADEARMEITKEEALANAPVKDSDYFKVPRVVG
ncbi:MAG: Asp-tRNA(Asn)/Glu-tRNA(Gln) amidotransferase subunit GatC [Bacteroidetes bacterium]|nr:Asp-tRNA(Asn)/Glu-tRNA(Gln) amidotransferase subunit GatC [Bacteroidota bacterium]MBS1943126.1 Asp-tRNA(Asn)/Glu-tRNA(Gln) amidotransferase subunit GatC [Bacteroidota bacterium]